MKTALIAVAALLILSPPSLATGGTLHLDVTQTPEPHYVEVTFDETGNVVLLLDGQPIAPPSPPGELPPAPSVPETPAPPTIPELPPLPDEDDIPGGV